MRALDGSRRVTKLIKGGDRRGHTSTRSVEKVGRCGKTTSSFCWGANRGKGQKKKGRRHGVANSAFSNQRDVVGKSDVRPGGVARAAAGGQKGELTKNGPYPGNRC